MPGRAKIGDEIAFHTSTKYAPTNKINAHAITGSIPTPPVPPRGHALRKRSKNWCYFLQVKKQPAWWSLNALNARLLLIVDQRIRQSVWVAGLSQISASLEKQCMWNSWLLHDRILLRFIFHGIILMFYTNLVLWWRLYPISIQGVSHFECNWNTLTLFRYVAFWRAIISNTWLEISSVWGECKFTRLAFHLTLA